MAYYFELVAIKYDSNDGSYEIVGKSESESLNINRKLLNNVSSNNFYLDEAIVVSKQNFSQYISDSNTKTLNWYNKLPESVALIMIVSREWETGLSWQYLFASKCLHSQPHFCQNLQRINLRAALRFILAGPVRASHRFPSILWRSAHGESQALWLPQGRAQE